METDRDEDTDCVLELFGPQLIGRKFLFLGHSRVEGVVEGVAKKGLRVVLSYPNGFTPKVVLPLSEVVSGLIKE